MRKSKKSEKKIKKWKIEKTWFSRKGKQKGSAKIAVGEDNKREREGGRDRRCQRKNILLTLKFSRDSGNEIQL